MNIGVAWKHNCTILISFLILCLFDSLKKLKIYLQNFFYILSHFLLLGIMDVGGWENIKYKFFNAISNNTWHKYLRNNLTKSDCGFPPSNSLHLFRSHTDGNYPWPGVVFGATVSGVWYWCSDQVQLKLNFCYILFLTNTF